MEPQYLSDPLLSVCKDICPIWKQGAAYYVDTQCLSGCSYALSQYACSPEKQAQLTTAIKQAATGNFYESLGSLKGVDLTTASLGFRIINTSIPAINK